MTIHDETWAAAEQAKRSWLAENGMYREEDEHSSCGVGLVVSIGVAIDSSVVSFEGIKEDVRNGSTVRSVAERSMTRSYSTIVKADTSSLIGAAVLYWLSVGPVRGFAFYLGAATLLDLFSAYFVLRPGVMALSRSGRGSSPKSLGIPIDDLADPVREKLTAAARGAVKEA